MKIEKKDHHLNVDLTQKTLKGLKVHTFLKYNKDKQTEHSFHPSVAPSFQNTSKQQDRTLSIFLLQAYLRVWGTNIISVN